MVGFRFRGYYGSRATDGARAAAPSRPGGGAASDGGRATDGAADHTAALGAVGLRLASPVGTAQDGEGNVWLADAGHNRLLVVDDGLERLLAVVGGVGTEPGRFDLPMRLAHHPTDRSIYVADTGNGRLQRLDYEYDGTVPRVTGAEPFAADGGFHPNGVVAHEYWDGVRVIAADEFYREGGDLRGRLVVFGESGEQIRSIRTVGDDHGTPLYWPQGLDTDDEGRIYVANTGYGVLHDGPTGPPKLATVVRCDRTGGAAPFEGLADEVLAELPMPRDVAVVGSGADAQIFVPDAATGRIHAYTSVGIADGAVPEDGEDIRANAALEDGIGIPHDGARPPVDDSAPADAGGQDRFRGPVGVAGFEGVSVPDSDADDPTLAVLTAEALAGRIGAYALDVHTESARRLGSVGAPRDRPGQFSTPTGSVVVDDPESPLGRCALVGDGGNGRLQRVDFAAATDGGRVADAGGDRGGARADGRVDPVALPATRFPFGLDYWPAGTGGGGRLFVTDYTAHYREAEGVGQIHVYAVDEDATNASGERSGAGVSLTLVDSFGPWGMGDGEVKLPRGIAVEPRGEGVARVWVADSANGRIGVWDYDRVLDGADPRGDRGCFGHIDGGFWNPSDLAVGERGVYVADENNNRLQRFDGDDWHPVGEPGYDGDREFLLPISVAARDGYLFVLDLVSRSIRVFAEDAAADGGLRPVDEHRAFGGDATAGELWLPYLLSVGDVSDAPGVDVVVPDSTLHVAQHYAWDGA
ncbi:NHL repeat containing protein [Halosimplex carlsbadense 2-9-1]|uniref:NHL repeat containing protein n=1 Tax=Halosimplex carlsbadense 2-9-1 TaxID=797114 RepID=M0D0E0_9EURY|nr:NHL repeat-containing protein [Halosimplex carlsbadense]ELZ28137.1 NHL repeat containing protein [Halosimplex carlsbadense 2-9-1]